MLWRYNQAVLIIYDGRRFLKIICSIEFIQINLTRTNLSIKTRKISKTLNLFLEFLFIGSHSTQNNINAWALINCYSIFTLVQNIHFWLNCYQYRVTTNFTLKLIITFIGTSECFSILEDIDPPNPPVPYRLGGGTPLNCLVI